MSDVLHKLTWSRIGAVGQWEDFELCRDDSVPQEVEWALGGIVRIQLDESFALVYYSVTCDENWTFRYGDISINRGSDSSPVYSSAGIVRTREGVWLVDDSDATGLRNRVERPDLADCIGIDLSITPSTNTLPIRRLNLAVGASAEVTAAWVRFPALVVQPLRQRYTRLAPDRYLYESLESDFTAELTVDDLGLVTHYPGGWELWTPDKE